MKIQHDISDFHGQNMTYMPINIIIYACFIAFT